MLPLDLAGLGVCGVLSALVYITGLHPLVQQRAEAADARRQLAAQQRSAQQLNTSQRQLEEQLSRLRASVPDTPIQLHNAEALNQRLDELIQLAHKCALTIDEVRPGAAANSEHHKELAIHLTGTGTFHAWTTFLNRAHDQFRDTKVRQIELEATPRPDSPHATCQLDLVWFLALK